MSARHQVSRAALELIEHFEGYRRQAARLADGRWTIGYGHTLTAREGAEVSRDDAEALLIYDVRPIAAAINELIYAPLTQNQFDALAAFAFNIGLDNFRRSAVLRRVNEGNLIQAAFALEMWRIADFEGEPIVVDALVRRRAAEKTLFLTPSGGWVAAPSPVLRPKLDVDAGVATPQSSTELDTPLTGDVAEAHRVTAAPYEEGSASLAAANAVAARLNQILPEPQRELELEPEPDSDLEPALKFEPDPAPALETEAVNEPLAAASPELAEPTAAPKSLEAAADAETPAQYAYLAAPALFGSLFATEADPPTETKPTETAEPTPALEAVAETPATPVAAPDAESGPMDLSRRVVWREAPPEIEISRTPTSQSSGASLPALAALFLVGLAVFSGAIMWGMNADGSAAVSWGLGLVGIACVVSAVYIYLERLGRRED